MKALEKYCIQNEYLKVQVKRKGAELCSVLGKNQTEFIWQAETVWPRHAPILFPVVGSLIDHEYILNNETYPMTHHGFARDLDFDLLQQSEHEICLILAESEETLKKWPFAFRLLITFKLEGHSLSQTFRVINHSENSMPVSFGAHPAFNVQPIEEFEVIFEKEEECLATLLDVPYLSKRTEMLIRDKRIELDQHSFDRDALVFKELSSNEVILNHKQSAYQVKMDMADWPYFGIWSKPGAPFVCLEPWQGLADHIDHNKQISDKEGIVWLDAGDSIEKKLTMTFTEAE